MDEKIRQAYRVQHTALRRQHRQRRWCMVGLFAVYYGLSAAGLRLFLYPLRMEIAVFALILNTVLSVSILLFSLNSDLKKEQAQWAALTEKAPLGKLRLHDD